jgi:hypothetical protein
MLRSSARSIALAVLVTSPAFLAACKNPMANGTDAGPAVVDAAPPPVVVLDAAPPDDTSAVDAGVPPLTPKPVLTAPAPIPFAAGESWNGTYNCGGQDSLKLQITSVIGSTVNAIFDFRNHGKTGAFHVSGKYDHVTRHLHLSAGAWIAQPPGFVPVDLDGVVGPEGHSYGGAVIGPRCSSFSTHH